jgi:hypothetical protein
VAPSPATGFPSSPILIHDVKEYHSETVVDSETLCTRRNLSSLPHDAHVEDFRQAQEHVLSKTVVPDLLSRGAALSSSSVYRDSSSLLHLARLHIPDGCWSTFFLYPYGMDFYQLTPLGILMTSPGVKLAKSEAVRAIPLLTRWENLILL